MNGDLKAKSEVDDHSGATNSTTISDFKKSHRSLLGASLYLIAAVAVLLGLLLKTLSLGKAGFLWEITGEIGSFLSVTFAVAFIYERVVRKQERLHVLDDLAKLLDEKLSNQSNGVLVYERGRPDLRQKLCLYLQAKDEVIELGTTLRTFTSYFEQYPAAEFRDPISKMLSSGVRFTCLLSSPESMTARLEGIDRQHKLENSLLKLSELAQEFSTITSTTNFRVLTYPNPPTFAAIVIDGATEASQILFSPYLFGLRFAESPAFLIRKSTHPMLFSKVWDCIQHHLRDSKQFPANTSSPLQTEAPATTRQS